MSKRICHRARTRSSAAVVVLAIVCAAFAFLAAPAMAAPPSNDLIENATVIDPLPFSATVSTAEATRSAADPVTSCGGSPNGTVWYRYDATASQVLRPHRRRHRVQPFVGGVPRHAVAGEPGRLLERRLARSDRHRRPDLLLPWAPTSGPPATFTLNVQVAAPPANDLLANATPIALPFHVTQSTQDATRDAADPSCGVGGPNVWFRYDAPATTAAPHHDLGTTRPSGRSVCSTAHPVPGARSRASAGNSRCRVTAGHTYFFMVNAGSSTSIDARRAGGDAAGQRPDRECDARSRRCPSPPVESTQDATGECDGSRRLHRPQRRTSGSATTRRAPRCFAITVSGGMGPFSVGVYEGSPGSLTPVTCTAFPVPGSGHRGHALLPHGQHRTSRRRSRCRVQVATPPANDLIEHATPIAVVAVRRPAEQPTTPPAVRPTRRRRAAHVGPNVWFRYDAPSTAAPAGDPRSSSVRQLARVPWCPWIADAASPA